MKGLRIKSQLVEMDFEQCYRQFAPLRKKIVTKYSNLLEHDDLVQEVNTAFYKAFLDYNNTDIAFITLATNYIIHHLATIDMYKKRKKRINDYGVDVSLYSQVPGENLFLDGLIASGNNLENTIILKIAIENVFDDMPKERVAAIRKLMNGYSLRETGRYFNKSQTAIANYKKEFTKKFKREMRC